MIRMIHGVSCASPPTSGVGLLATSSQVSAPTVNGYWNPPGQRQFLRGGHEEGSGIGPAGQVERDVEVAPRSGRGLSRRAGGVCQSLPYHGSGPGGIREGEREPAAGAIRQHARDHAGGGQCPVRQRLLIGREDLAHGGSVARGRRHDQAGAPLGGHHEPLVARGEHRARGGDEQRGSALARFGYRAEQAERLLDARERAAEHGGGLPGPLLQEHPLLIPDDALRDHRRGDDRRAQDDQGHD